jgi:hypothetical protein
MQDVIFCVPRIGNDPGRKVVITTVALRGATAQPEDLFLYYADPILGPFVDMTDTLKDPEHWLNKLSVNLRHIDEIRRDDVRLPSVPNSI